MPTSLETSLARLSQRQGKRIKELEAVNAELLEAAELAQRYLMTLGKPGLIIDMLRAAIAKAEAKP